MACLDEPEKAENYFKLALACSASYPTGLHDLHQMILYCNYGSFLCDQKRYCESVKTFQCALDINNRSALNHHGLSRTYYKMKEFDKFEYHLNKSLELNPYLKDAIDDWNKYMNKNSQMAHKFNGIDKTICNSIENENKTDEKCSELSGNEIDNIFAVEFDRFWFDEIGNTTATFNKYYDNILYNGLKDIRVILFDNNIYEKLQNIIGVKSLNDLNLIMKNIEKQKNKHNIFVDILNKKQLKQYYSIFTENAIYTLDAFRCHIQSKQDINMHVTKQFEMHDDIVDLIHSFKDNLR